MVAVERSLEALPETLQQFRCTSDKHAISCAPDDFQICLDRIRELEYTCSGIPELEEKVARISNQLADEKLSEKRGLLSASVESFSRDSARTRLDALEKDMEHVRKTSEDHSAELPRVLQFAKRTENAVSTLR